jgi:hypothetical protein
MVAITVVPKVALIAVLTVFDCEPLQLAVHVYSMRYSR